MTTMAGEKGSVDTQSGVVEIKSGTSDNRIIVDAAGAIAINSIPAITGTVTETNSGTIAADTTSIDGKITACDTGSVTIVSSALPTGAATEVTVATLATESTLSTINGKITAVDTGSVTISASALPTGAATEATLANVSTETTLSTINGKITACDTGSVVVSSGSITETNSSAIAGSTASIDGKLHNDAITSALVVMEATAHEVNDGNFFSLIINDTAVDNAAPKYVSITAPATHEIHAEFSLSSDGAGIVELYEQPTIDVAGTSRTPYNNNRNSSNTTTATTQEDPTVTVDGTLLDAIYVGASNNKTHIGGGTRSSNEVILHAGYTYIVKFTPTNDNTKCAIGISFYESGLGGA